MTTDKAPYFYAAYSIVLGLLLAYVGFLAFKVKTLEDRLKK